MQTFQQKIMLLDKNDSSYEARKQYDDNIEGELGVIDSFEKAKNKRKLCHIDEKIENCFDLRKTKILLEFNNPKSDSIKLFAVKKRHNVKVTSRFMSGKLLMFAKLLLKSFG